MEVIREEIKVEYLKFNGIFTIMYELKHLGQSSIFDLAEYEYDREYYYENYQRAKPIFDPGGFTVEARKILLEYLLYVQEKVGEPLIEEQEVRAILTAWKQTDGITYRFEDLQLKEFHFDGTISFDADGHIKKTNNPNQIFYIDVEMNMSEDELIHYLKERQRQTKRSLFCFPSYQEFQNERLVWNKATFVVCESNIQTKEQAREQVWDWLGWTDGVTEESQNLSIRYLFTSAIGEALEKKYDWLNQAKKKEFEQTIDLTEEENGQLSLI